MSILLFGGTGVLGSEILSKLQKEKKEVFAPTRDEFDILYGRTNKLNKWISNNDIIINCSDNKLEAKEMHMYHINTVFPTYTAQKVSEKRKHSIFIQISTEYIFPGIGGTGVQPYDYILPMIPEFSTKPSYSFTKYQAENNVLQFDGYIIRSPYIPIPKGEKIKSVSNFLTSAEWADQIAEKVCKVILNTNILEKRDFHIVHVGSERPRRVSDIVSERFNVEPIKGEQNMDYSLDTTLYYRYFDHIKVK